MGGLFFDESFYERLASGSAVVTEVTESWLKEVLTTGPLSQAALNEIQRLGLDIPVTAQGYPIKIEGVLGE